MVTDASFCPKTKVGGWAAWISLDGGLKVKQSGGFSVPLRCNNEAEIYAALNGIWLARRHGADEILLRSDSGVVCGLAKGKGPRGRLLTIWRQGLLNQTIKGARISAKHVKGHSDDLAAASWVNRWCDLHAGVEMRKARGEGYERHRRNNR
ncbi:MAG: ribonuclease HI [Beijerinckiaceae bacterium]